MSIYCVRRTEKGLQIKKSANKTGEGHLLKSIMWHQKETRKSNSSQKMTFCNPTIRNTNGILPRNLPNKDTNTATAISSRLCKSKKSLLLPVFCTLFHICLCVISVGTRLHTRKPFVNQARCVLYRYSISSLSHWASYIYVKYIHISLSTACIFPTRACNPQPFMISVTCRMKKQNKKKKLSVNTATLVWKHESSFKNKALSVGPWAVFCSVEDDDEDDGWS